MTRRLKHTSGDPDRIGQMVHEAEAQHDVEPLGLYVIGEDVCLQELNTFVKWVVAAPLNETRLLDMLGVLVEAHDAGGSTFRQTKAPVPRATGEVDAVLPRQRRTVQLIQD